MVIKVGAKSTSEAHIAKTEDIEIKQNNATDPADGGTVFDGDEGGVVSDGITKEELEVCPTLKENFTVDTPNIEATVMGTGAYAGEADTVIITAAGGFQYLNCDNASDPRLVTMTPGGPAYNHTNPEEDVDGYTAYNGSEVVFLGDVNQGETPVTVVVPADGEMPTVIPDGHHAALPGVGYVEDSICESEATLVANPSNVMTGYESVLVGANTADAHYEYQKMPNGFVAGVPIDKYGDNIEGSDVNIYEWNTSDVCWDKQDEIEFDYLAGVETQSGYVVGASLVPDSPNGVHITSVDIFPDGPESAQSQHLAYSSPSVVPSGTIPETSYTLDPLTFFGLATEGQAPQESTTLVSNDGKWYDPLVNIAKEVTDIDNYIPAGTYNPHTGNCKIGGLLDSGPLNAICTVILTGTEDFGGETGLVPEDNPFDQ